MSHHAMTPHISGTSLSAQARYAGEHVHHASPALSPLLLSRMRAPSAPAPRNRALASRHWRARRFPPFSILRSHPPCRCVCNATQRGADSWCARDAGRLLRRHADPRRVPDCAGRQAGGCRRALVLRGQRHRWLRGGRQVRVPCCRRQRRVWCAVQQLLPGAFRFRFLRESALLPVVAVPCPPRAVPFPLPSVPARCFAGSRTSKLSLAIASCPSLPRECAPSPLPPRGGAIFKYSVAAYRRNTDSAVMST